MSTSVIEGKVPQTEGREVIVPENKEAWLKLRLQDVTSTEVAALFGVSPYLTRFELWHRKRNATIVEIEENERMKWGSRLEEPIAKGIAQDNKLAIRSMKEYMRDPAIRLGASFDYRILAKATAQIAAGIVTGQDVDVSDSEDDEILEIKNVDSLAFREGWAVNDDGSVEAPPHIELQVQVEMEVAKLKKCRIGALVGGNAPVVIVREKDEAIAAVIRSKVREFWADVEGNNKPSPDFIKDADFIVTLQSFAEPGKTIDLSYDAHMLEVAKEYKALGDAAKRATEARDGLKAEMLMRIGDCEKAIGNGFKISAGMVGPTPIQYERAGYRDFRVTWPKAARK